MRLSVFVLLVLGVTLRVAVWFGHGADLFADSTMTALMRADCQGLLLDPMRLVLWEHTRLPILAGRELLKCALAPLILPAHLDLLMVAAADTVAAALLFPVLERMAVPPRMAFFIAAAWSIALVAWEYYRGGGTHNHLNIAILTLCLFAALRRFQDPGRGADLFFAGAALLLCLSYGPSVLIIPILALGSLRPQMGPRRLVVSLCLALSLPALAVTATTYKNYTRFGEMSPSTYLALNLSQFAYIGMGYDAPEAKLNALLPKLQPSPWWTWCYDRARNLTGTSRVIDALRGQCLDFDTPESLRDGARSAERLADAPFMKSLNRDIDVAVNAPWLLRVGSPPVMTTATEVVFAQTTKRLWNLMLMQYPMGMLHAFLQANRSFFVWGPLMFDGVHYEPHLARGSSAINLAATIFALLPLFGVVGGAWLLGLAAIRGAIRLPRGLDALRAVVTPEQFILCIYLVAFFASAMIMNSVSCCENGRQFQSLSPIPLIAGSCFLAWAMRQLAVRRSGTPDRSPPA